MVVAGSVVYSYKFEFQGLAAYAVELSDGGSSVDTSYSLISTGEMISESAEDPDDLGIRWIQMAFFAYGFAMPLLHMLSLLLLWVMPFTLKAQRKIFVLTEVTNAWSGLEVFVVSIIAALLEIETFAQFLVAPYCEDKTGPNGNNINDIIKQFFKAHDIDEEGVCFDVIATLDQGCWILFAAAFIFIVVGQAVMRSAHCAIEDRTRDALLEVGKVPTDDLNLNMHIAQEVDGAAPGVHADGVVRTASASVTSDLTGATDFETVETELVEQAAPPATAAVRIVEFFSVLGLTTIEIDRGD